jgi:hypothetical protein
MAGISFLEGRCSACRESMNSSVRSLCFAVYTGLTHQFAKCGDLLKNLLFTGEIRLARGRSAGK